MSNLIDELKEELSPKQNNLEQDAEYVLNKMFDIIGTSAFNSLFMNSLSRWDEYIDNFKKDLDKYE